MNKRSEDKDSHVSKALSLKGDKKWFDHNLAVFFYGLRDGLGLNTIGILVYNAAGSGGVYSKLNVLFSFITIITYRVIKRFLAKDKIEKKIEEVVKEFGLTNFLHQREISKSVLINKDNSLWFTWLHTGLEVLVIPYECSYGLVRHPVLEVVEQIPTYAYLLLRHFLLDYVQLHGI